MLRRGTIIMSSFLGLLLFAAPGWTQFRRGVSMGTMSFYHPPGAYVYSARGFPPYGAGTFMSSWHGFPVYGTGIAVSGVRLAPDYGNGGLASPPTQYVPTSYGPTVIVPRASFVPGAAGLYRSGYSSVNPAAFVSPLANPVFSQSAYAHTLRHYEREAGWANYYNPYPYGAYGYGGYGGYANPYVGYGASNYGIAPTYGSGASNPYVGAENNAITQVAANNNASPAQPKSTDALKAFGIPVEFGEVQWPLALRLMPPDAKRDLLDKLESQMKIAANQATKGNASQAVLRDTKSTIDSVRGWLRGRRANMAESTYQDGNAFLSQLENSLRRMDRD